MEIRIVESDGSSRLDKATLFIDLNPDEDFVSLSINNGDEFFFDANELLRALNAVFMFRRVNSS